MKQSSLLSIGLLSGLAVTYVVFAFEAWQLLFATFLLVLALPPLIDLTSHQFDLFSTRNIFCLGYFQAFGLSTLYSVLIQCRHIDRSRFMELLPLTLGCVLIGLIAYYLGYYSGVGRDLSRRLPALASLWNSARLPGLLAAYVAIGLAALGTMILQSGGLRYY